MTGRRYEIDMTRGSILKNMIAFAIPLILTNVLQLLYNAADLVVVGRWAGTDSLAAVGATTFITTLLTNTFISISVGASIVVSKQYGARDMQGINRAVHTTISLSLWCGLVALIVGQVFCGPILELLGTPESIIELSALYMRIIFIGVPAQILYNFGAAILRSVGDTKRPLYVLSVTGIVNVVLNLVLVIFFNMDVAGVAIATAVAHYLSAGAVMYSLIKSDVVYKVNVKELKIHKEELKQIIAVGLPAGIQSSVFSFGNIVAQSAVNSLGTAVVAGRTAGSNIEQFVNAAMESFNQATVTSVGQNYGAKNEKRVYKTIITGLICASICGLVLGVTVYIFGEFLLGMYIVNSAEAIREGMVYMAVVGLPYVLMGIMNVLSGSIRGLGHSKTPAICSLIGACGFRILWIYAAFPLNKTSWFLYLCWPISWVIVIIMHTITFMVVRKKSMQNMYEA